MKACNKFVAMARSVNMSADFAHKAYNLAKAAYERSHLYYLYEVSNENLIILQRDYCIFLQDMGVSLHEAESCADYCDMPKLFSDKSTAMDFLASIKHAKEEMYKAYSSYHNISKYSQL